MRRIGLKYKLLLGPIVMVCLVMIVSLIVVVMVLKRQNRSTSYDQIQKAVRIVQEDLQARQSRLLEAARQVSGAYDLGARVKYAYEFKEQGSSKTDGTSILWHNGCKKITQELSLVAVARNIWKMAIYNPKGELPLLQFERSPGPTSLDTVWMPPHLTHSTLMNNGRRKR